MRALILTLFLSDCLIYLGYVYGCDFLLDIGLPLYLGSLAILLYTWFKPLPDFRVVRIGGRIAIV